MTALIAGALTLLLAASPQRTEDLRKAIGQTRRICAVVVDVADLGKEGSGDCGAKFFLSENGHKLKFYFIIPTDVGAQFSGRVRGLLAQQQVCVTGEIAADTKRTPYISVTSPAQVEVMQRPGPPFGATAHDNCEAGFARPKLIKSVRPIYPSGESFERRLEGIVALDIVIDEVGLVTEARVVSGRYAGFNDSAIDAVRQWRFRPATLTGRPIASVARVELRFTPR